MCYLTSKIFEWNKTMKQCDEYTLDKCFVTGSTLTPFLSAELCNHSFSISEKTNSLRGDPRSPWSGQLAKKITADKWTGNSVYVLVRTCISLCLEIYCGYLLLL